MSVEAKSPAGALAASVGLFDQGKTIARLRQKRHENFTVHLRESGRNSLADHGAKLRHPSSLQGFAPIEICWNRLEKRTLQRTQDAVFEGMDSPAAPDPARRRGDGGGGACRFHPPIAGPAKTSYQPSLTVCHHDRSEKRLTAG